MAIAHVAARGTATSSTSSASISITASNTIAKWNLLVLTAAVDNAGTLGAAPVMTVTDTPGNTWEIRTALRDPGAFNEGTVSVLAFAVVQNVYAVGNTVTLNFFDADGVTPLNVGTKAATMNEFSGIRRIDPETGDDFSSGASTTPVVDFTNVPGGTRLVVATLAVESSLSETLTADADSDGGDTWHVLSRAGTNNGVFVDQTVNTVYKIPVTTVTQSWGPTQASARDWAMRMSLFGILVEPEGSFTATLGTITGQVTGKVEVGGSLAGALPGPLTGALTGYNTLITGTIDVVLPALEADLTGQQPDAIGADMVGVLPVVEGFLVGQRPGASFLEGTLPALEAEFEMQRQGTDGTVNVRARRQVLDSHAFPTRWPPYRYP